MKPILEVQGITKLFGGLTALNDVSFCAAAGSIHGLIGPNGAGKSTMFKIIAGFHRATRGDVQFDGSSVSGMKPSRIARAGLIRTFQETTLFQELSVLENVLIGTHNHAATNIFAAVLGLDRRKQSEAMAHSLEVLEFMGLMDRKHQLASELPLGSKRALAISVALAAKPRLLLMDEPFAGMNPQETGHIMELTRKVCDSGVTVVLVEHDMKAVMGLCEELTVLNFGTVLAGGTPEQVRNNPDVISAYLGGGDAA